MRRATAGAWAALAALVLAAGACAPRQANGTYRFTRRDGTEVWATPEDRRLHRLHVRDRQGEALIYDSAADAPRTLPPRVARMMVRGAGLVHRPDWAPAYPGSTEDPQFAELTPGGRVMGSWILDTHDSPEAVRRFYADTLERMGFAVRPGPPPVPGPRVAAFMHAESGPRQVNVRVERGDTGGARAEVAYRIGP